MGASLRKAREKLTTKATKVTKEALQSENLLASASLGDYKTSATKMMGKIGMRESILSP
jgi:hypothetical protein